MCGCPKNTPSTHVETIKYHTKSSSCSLIHLFVKDKNQWKKSEEKKANQQISHPGEIPQWHPFVSIQRWHPTTNQVTPVGTAKVGTFHWGVVPLIDMGFSWSIFFAENKNGWAQLLIKRKKNFPVTGIIYKSVLIQKTQRHKATKSWR